MYQLESSCKIKAPCSGHNCINFHFRFLNHNSVTMPTFIIYFYGYSHILENKQTDAMRIILMMSNEHTVYCHQN